MRLVESTDGIRLAIYEHGDKSNPTIVCVHGYPDNHAVWDGVVDELKGRFHIVTYDVRGAGNSDTPTDKSGYLIDQLVQDLAVVIVNTSPEQQVHVLAHDWGSMQCWDALAQDRLGPNILSFTSISGPSIDHIGKWLRRIFLNPQNVLRQIVKSYYIYGMFIPLLPEKLARLGLVSWIVKKSSNSGVPKNLRMDSGYERELSDEINGMNLYRANFIRRLLRPNPPMVDVPVQIIAPKSDMHVVVNLASDAPHSYASDLLVRRVRGNHWIVENQPQLVAKLVEDFIQEVSP